MTPLFPAQRAAEEFDQVLGGTATQAVTDRYAELLDTVVLLREQPGVTPRVEFVGDLRERLMTAAETELVAAPTAVRHLEPARTSPTRRRLGTLAASLVIVGGTAGMAAAASGALPGEALYPIKRGVEQVTTAVHLGDAAQGEALLDQAATRLDEVRELQAQPNPDADLIAATVESFRTTADAGSDKLFASYRADGDSQDIATVRTFTATQMADVADMSSALEGGADSVLVDVADTLALIDQQARVLCASCAPGTTLAPPGTLSSGAGAASLDNLLTRPVAQARADIAQVQAIEAARVARLKAQAEQEAGQLPTPPARGAIGTHPEAPSLTDPDAPLTSTITKDGRLVPSTITSSAGTAVKSLVSGVTTSVNELTTPLAPPTTPLGDGVKDLTDTVDKTVDGLLP